MSDLPAGLLLTAKQVIPPLRGGAVRRDRLHRMLTTSTTRLTLVVAPAGWGKTSLLTGWAHDPGERRRIAWVSLDETDDEPVRFWTYMLGALRQASDEIGPAAGTALAAPGADPLNVALPTLLNELAAASAEHVLVIDDFHVITDRRIHDGVEFLLSYLPVGLRLVIAGRHVPALPLALLRGRGELTELRTNDLRFTVDESATLVASVADIGLDAAASANLWARTEGWAAGLHLAGLALRGTSDPAAAASAVRGDHRHLLDYFSAEVLPVLSPEQRDVLVRAAPLEHLSGPLCDAALGRTGSAAILAELDRADLFVVPLDGHREWYRCHRLFRDALLRDSLDEGNARAVLSRAAEWFAANGRVDDAVRHHLGAGDDAAAAALMCSAESWFFERGAAAAYLTFGERLGVGVAGAQVCLMLAYAAAVSGHVDRVVPWLDACEAQLTPETVIDGWHSAEAAAWTMRATFGFAQDDPAAALDLARRALAREADPATEGHLVARAALGAALVRAARFDEAADLLLETWRRTRRQTLPTAITLRTAGLLGHSLLELGRTPEVKRLLREVTPVADTIERQWGAAGAADVTMVRIVEGRLAYLGGDSAAACRLLDRAAALAAVGAGPTHLVIALTALADAQLADGDRTAARVTLARAREVTDDEPVTPHAAQRLEAAQARLGRGAVHAARRSGAMVEELTDRELSILRALTGSATQREIGAALFLSINTVKAYTKSLYRKLGVPTRQDAVSTARELGLI